MSWAGIASNQTVTCNNLQDAVNNGIFFQKNTIPVSNKCITKAEAEYYVDINTISGKTSNQLVVKSNLVSPGYYYQMERFNCTTCTGELAFIVGYSSIPLTLNYFYATINPYTYQRQAQIASTTIDINFSSISGTTSCVSCAPPPTYTINIYGKRTTGARTLGYSINGGVYQGFDVSMGTAGALMYTLTGIASGTVINIQTDNASSVTTLHCNSTSAYCTTYDQCTSTNVITGNTNIYIGSSATTC